MQNRKFDLRRVRELISASAILLVLIGGAGGMGYWYGTENMRTIIAAIQANHLDEIKRLQDAHQIALRATAGSVERAAESVAKAATARPSVIVRTPAPAPAAPALEGNRRAVNNTIQRANEQLEGGGK